EGLAGGDALGRALVPCAPEADVELAHILLAVAGGTKGGVGAVTAQVQPGEHGAVGPAVDHVPPVLVAVPGGQGPVEVRLRAGDFLKACGVVQDIDGAHGPLDVGGQAGGAGHGHIGVGVRLCAPAVVQGVDVESNHRFPVPVQ